MVKYNYKTYKTIGDSRLPIVTTTYSQSRGISSYSWSLSCIESL